MKRFSEPETTCSHREQCSFAVRTGVLLFALSIAAVLVLHTPACAAQTEAWEIDFVSAIYGKCRATVTQKCARFDWGAFVMLLNPPDYSTLYLVNPTSKLFRREALSKFMLQKWERQLVDGHVARLKKTGVSTLENLKCDNYSCEVFGEETEFQVTKQMDPDPGLAAACCRLLEIPPGYGIPVGCQRHRTEVRKMWLPESGTRSARLVRKDQKLRANLQWLRLVSLREKKMDANLLLMPKDYRLASDDFSLWFSKSGKAGQDDIADFFMSDPYHKKEESDRAGKAPPKGK